MKLKIESTNRKVKKCLSSLFNDVLNIDLNSNMWIESIKNHNDLFLHLDIDEKKGIVNIIPLPSCDVLHIAEHKPLKTKKEITRSILKQLEKAAVLHLYALGFSQKQILNFKLSF
jgi:hypothetical protein